MAMERFQFAAVMVRNISLSVFKDNPVGWFVLKLIIITPFSSKNDFLVIPNEDCLDASTRTPIPMQSHRKLLRQRL